MLNLQRRGPSRIVAAVLSLRIRATPETDDGIPAAQRRRLHGHDG
jgi:hypothetical protein